MRREDRLIAGGGPAGAAAAIRLAGQGMPALLLERDRETGDAICGGFLSWRTVAALEELGIDVPALRGHRITNARLIAGGRTAEAALPHPSIGLSRRTLDTALLAKVDRVERGVVIREAAAGHVRIADGAELTANALFLATGKHDVRGLARPRDEADPTLGLRLHLEANGSLSATLADTIELHLFDRGYAGLALQEDGRANLCMAVHRSRLAEAEGNPIRLLDKLTAENPRLGERMAAGRATGPVQAIANVPYGWRARRGEAGLFRLGDQAAVIPSLAGEGIGIALASAARAVHAHVAGDDGRRFQPSLARSLRRPLAAAGLLRRLGEDPRRAGPLVTLLGHAPWLVGPLARLTRT